MAERVPGLFFEVEFDSTKADAALNAFRARANAALRTVTTEAGRTGAATRGMSQQFDATRAHAVSMSAALDRSTAELRGLSTQMAAAGRGAQALGGSMAAQRVTAYGAAAQGAAAHTTALGARLAAQAATAEALSQRMAALSASTVTGGVAFGKQSILVDQYGRAMAAAGAKTAAVVGAASAPKLEPFARTLASLGPGAKGAAAGMDTLAVSSGGAAAAVRSVYTTLVPLLAALGAFVAFRKLLDFMGESVTAAQEQEAAEVKLANALAIRGQATDELLDKMVSHAQAMQSYLGVSDEVLIAEEARMIQLGVSADLAERAAVAAADLATNSGRAIESVSMTLARGIVSGQQLAKLVPDLDSAAIKAMTMDQRLAAVEKRFAGTAHAATLTYAGAMANLARQFGEVQESLGGFVVRSPAVRAALEGWAKAMETLSQSAGGTLDIMRPFALFALDFTIVALKAAGAIDLWARSHAGLAVVVLKSLPLVKDFSSTLGLLEKWAGGEQITKQLTDAGSVLGPMLADLQKARKELLATEGLLTKVKAPGPRPTVNFDDMGEFEPKKAEPLGFGLDEVVDARDELAKFEESWAKVVSKIKTFTPEQASAAWAAAGEQVEKFNKLGLTPLGFAYDEVSGTIQEANIAKWIYDDVQALYDLPEAAAQAEDALWLLNTAIEQGFVTEAGAANVAEKLARDILSLSDAGQSFKEGTVAWAEGVVQTADALREFEQYVNSFEAQAWRAIGMSRQLAGAMAEIEQAGMLVVNSMGAILGRQNAFVKAISKIQAGLLLVRGIITIKEGAMHVAQGVATRNPQLIAGGVMEIAKGLDAVATAKQLGASGGASAGGGASRGGGGADAGGGGASGYRPRAVDPTGGAGQPWYTQPRMEPGTGEQPTSGSVLTPSTMPKSTSGGLRIGNVYAMDAKSFRDWAMQDPERRRAIGEAAFLSWEGR